MTARPIREVEINASMNVLYGFRIQTTLTDEELRAAMYNFLTPSELVAPGKSLEDYSIKTLDWNWERDSEGKYWINHNPPPRRVLAADVDVLVKEEEEEEMQPTQLPSWHMPQFPGYRSPYQRVEGDIIPWPGYTLPALQPE
jgi:hypothetical protein